MERIIYDYYSKQNKRLWDLNPEMIENQKFNEKITAVNNMYGWLYEQGLLRDLSLKFKDYSDMCYFVLDANELAPYRDQMLRSGVHGADLAVQHIFDEEYTPCLYSGAIQLGWTMRTYRDFDGTVGRSWECGLVQGLNSPTVLDIEVTKNETGVKAAISQAFELYGFEPDLFDLACEYYKEWVNVDEIAGNRDFLYQNSDKLIYCFENKKDLIDFDFWVQYEALTGEKITWDEYIAIDSQFDGDPHDIDPRDVEIISGFKKSLEEYRQGKDTMQALDDSIRVAKETHEHQASSTYKTDLGVLER